VDVPSDSRRLRMPREAMLIVRCGRVQIERLGGWSGYTSQRPPGMPTLVHGLRQFESIFLGWKLAQS